MPRAGRGTERAPPEQTRRADRLRRASDRGAYTRFTRAVYEARCSRFITPELESERFAVSVDEEAVKRAKALADIESGFRVLTRDIEIGSVYHHKPDRIRAHGMICFLALLLHRVMRLRLRGLNKLNPQQLELFAALEVPKPVADAM